MRLKILIFSLVVGIIIGGFALPKKTEAFLGFGDVVFDPANLATNIESFGLNLLEQTYKSLRDQASKRIIDSIVNDTAKWVENRGSPRFVTDWKKFLKDAGNKAVGDVIEETDLAFVCSPFKVQLHFALQQSYNYEDQVTCTLDQVVDNIEAFYDDFSQGGWVAYNQMWNSNNNFYGAYISGLNEIAMRTQEEEEAAKNEAMAGGGFLSVKTGGECLEFESADSIRSACLGQFASDSPEYESCFNEKWAQAECIKRAPTTTETPGGAVGEMVANAITADTQWAMNIESWTSVLVNAMVSRLTKEGVGLIKAGTKSVLDGGEDSLPAGYSAETQELADQKADSENKSMISKLQKFVDFDWEYLIGLKQESLVSMKKNYAMASMMEYRKTLSPAIGCNIPFGFEYRPKTLERKTKDSLVETQAIADNVSSTIALAKELMAEINLATSPTERLSVQQRYNDFISQNDFAGVESNIQSAEQEWQNSNSVLADLWKEFDRPECYSPEFLKYAGDGQKYLVDFADELLEGKTISEILKP